MYQREILRGADYLRKNSGLEGILRGRALV